MTEAESLRAQLADARALLAAAGIGDVNAWDARRQAWLAANPESPNLCWKCGARKPTNFAREDGCSDCGASGAPESPRAYVVHDFGTDMAIAVPERNQHESHDDS